MFGVFLVMPFLGVNKNLLVAAADTPCRIELAENWKLMSSKDMQADGTTISVAPTMMTAGTRFSGCRQLFLKYFRKMRLSRPVCRQKFIGKSTTGFI